MLHIRLLDGVLVCMRTVRALCLLVVLTACGSLQSLPADVLQYNWHWPLPATLLLQVEPTAGTVQDYLLVLQDESGVLRASLFDPAGMPVARKQLRDGHWRNEGLLPPHAAAESWLTAIVRRLADDRRPVNESIQLELPNGSRLLVRQLESP